MQDMALHMAQDQQLPAVEPWRMALWLMVYYPWLVASYWQWPNIVPLLHPNYKQQPKFSPPPAPAWTAILGVLHIKQRPMWQWWTNNKLSCSGEGTYWVHLMACPQKLLNFYEQLFHNCQCKSMLQLNLCLCKPFFGQLEQQTHVPSIHLQQGQQEQLEDWDEVMPLDETLWEHHNMSTVSKRLTTDNNHIPNSRFVKLNHANWKKRKKKKQLRYL